MSEQPEGVTVTDNEDGTQTIHATARLEATITNGKQEDG